MRTVDRLFLGGDAHCEIRHAYRMGSISLLTLPGATTRPPGIRRAGQHAGGGRAALISMLKEAKSKLG
jgi:hypothetical protein